MYPTIIDIFINTHTHKHTHMHVRQIRAPSRYFIFRFTSRNSANWCNW